jgi:hypothetical protein
LEHPSEQLSDEAFEALIDEATRLIVRYLQKCVSGECIAQHASRNN